MFTIIRYNFPQIIILYILKQEWGPIYRCWCRVFPVAPFFLLLGKRWRVDWPSWEGPRLAYFVNSTTSTSG